MVTSNTLKCLDIPNNCTSQIHWAFNKGKHSEKSEQWYGRMRDVCGISFKVATFDDFHRYFKCQNMQPEVCNEQGLLFPNKCSIPPCNQCYVKKEVS